MRRELRFTRRSMKKTNRLLPKKITQKQKRERIAVTTIIGTLLSLLYVVIFGFSAQNAEESGNLSREVTEKCVETVTELSGKKVDEAEKLRLVDLLEKPVRKMAHFTEYAVMGVLVCILLSQWYEKNRMRFWYNIGWVFVSAVFDEIHQYFIPGRWASVWDVMLDTAGGMAGIAAAFLCRYLFLKINRIAFRREDF